MQTYEVDVPAKSGEGKPRRHIGWKEKELLKTYDAKVTTLYENFLRGVSVSKNDNCFGVRKMDNGVAGPFVWQTYGEVFARVMNVGSALKHFGLEKGNMVGLFSQNRPEWVIAEQACNAFSYVSVPLYDVLGKDAVEYIINQTEQPVVFATSDTAKNVLSQLDKLPSLKYVIIMDNKKPDIQVPETFKVLTFEEVEKLGAENKSEAVPPSAEDLATICYTSGTTGTPKGVLLTHANLIADTGALMFLGEKGMSLRIMKEDVHLSYLPLAHMFERIVQCYIFGFGASIGFFQGDTRKLLEDIAELKPTLFPSVPRLLNKVYDKVIAKMNNESSVVKFLFDTAYGAKKEYLKQGYVTHWLWDRLIFAKVKERLGGRVKYIVTGSAPIGSDVMDFLRIAFCCEVFEGYGQTETAAGATITMTRDYEPGHIGVPIPCCEVKLVDVPDMNYTSNDKPFPRGEICMKGHNVTAGYYKNEEKTKETIDEDGYLHSGDIGMWDDKGRLKIIDRKKNIFKLAQGEYIAPEKIENITVKNTYIAQAFVHGDSLEAFLVAILFPDPETVLPWCKQNGIEASKIDDVLTNEKLLKFIKDELVATAKAAKLKSFEIPRKITLVSEEFSVDNGLLTPTFKLKRPQAKEKYQAAIDAMYAEIKAEEDAKKKDLKD